MHIRNEEHRQELIRDCKYFHFRGLEQQLIAHEISYSQRRQRKEITIRLEDIRPPGLSLVSDATTIGIAHYARPFVDKGTAYELIVNTGANAVTIDSSTMTATFHGNAVIQVGELVRKLAECLPGEIRISTTKNFENSMQVVIDAGTSALVDGEPWESDGPNTEPPMKRQKRLLEGDGQPPWVVRQGLWRIGVKTENSTRKVDSVAFSLLAVKFEALTTERARNVTRKFLN